MAIKIGFYICHCGINISYRVRVEEVADFIAKLPNVKVARDYKFMCSDPGQEMIEKDIRELGINRVVVASCSPRFHEKTFQAACFRAGLNPYYFQMASVREHVSWVTENEDEATRKAKTLSAAAVNRVKYHKTLESRSVNVNPDIMVVGGGIAGMQSALDIGSSGRKAFLVEKDTSIGGHMLQFDKTFPTLDCAACIGTPKMVAVTQDPNINLLSYSEVEEVSGYVGNFTVSVKKKARFIDASKCTGCGECTKVCPVTLPSLWDEKLSNRNAIYRSFPQAVPGAFCIEKLDPAPCQQTCPAGVNVQGYVQMIGQGKFKEAVRIIRERIPFPGVLGRVCPHPCETACRRSEVDEPIAIRELKRFASDQVDLLSLPQQIIESRDEKVAVIGSGPSGLTVAYDLRLKGYQVTLFEADTLLGGMMRTGIPDYRLPPEILDKEIQAVLNLGILVKTDFTFGKDLTLADLEEQNYAAVFIGIGAQKGSGLNLPGEESVTGVIDALSFLKDANLGSRNKPGNRVVIVGGGNVAVDTAGVAKRLGVNEVTIVYRRSKKEMPAFDEEIREVLEEGVELKCLTAPIKIVSEAGKVVGLECIETELGPVDESGRRRPVPVQGSEFIYYCDAIIPAIGQKSDSSWSDQLPNLHWTASNRIEIDSETGQTTIAKVFAGGDITRGPATVVEAIADGHVAAESIHAYLNNRLNEDFISELQSSKVNGNTWVDIPTDSHIHSRAVPTQLESGIRSSSFDEISLGLDDQQAKAEAKRCLNCSGCCECLECVNVCEANAINHQMEPEMIDIDVGSIVVATGYNLMDAKQVKQFGYGKYSNVYTSLEFERLSNATGPTGGKILIKDENGDYTKKPQSVALIHCVGSRDTNYHQYCSRVCCMYALKYSHLIKEKVGHDTEIYDFFIDQRCYGKGYEEFYMRCQNEGTNFIRGKVAQVTQKALKPGEEGKLVAIAEDTLLGEKLRIPVDMVVLCVAMEAREDAQEVARTFGLNIGSDGFFLEEHPKLAPLNTPTDGVFLAGTCQGPKDIPDTVAQASGAAAKALALSVKGEVAVSPTISFIDPVLCAGCQVCIGLCPYSAIEYNERRGISVINEALCKGCGSCAGHCPSSAAQIKHFNPKQVFSELDGLMNAIQEVGI